MHKNRKLDLEKYQTILKERAFKLAFLINDKESGEMYIMRPRIKSMWLRDYMDAYFKPRSVLLFNKLKEKKCRMITLTYHTELYTPEQVAKRHKADFKKFVRIMRKKYPAFEYCYFIEVTKKYYIHFHIYTDIFIPHRRIKIIWSQITGSYIVNVNYIKSEKQIDYCSNYHNVAKKYTHEQLKFVWKNVSRFFGQSRKFFVKRDLEESKFELMGFLEFRGVHLLQALQVEKFNKCYMLPILEAYSCIDGLFFDIIHDIENNRYIINGIFDKSYKIEELKE